MNDLLSELDPAQRRVVLHDAGSLLVIAGPGSGKTRVMTRRIAYRIATGINAPHRILAVTFTNRAAEEMKERVRAQTPEAAQVRIGTFHRMCNSMLRRYGHRLGLRRDFQLLSPDAARRELRAVADIAGLGDYNLKDLAAEIGIAKNGVKVTTSSQQNGVQGSGLKTLLSLYEERLRAKHLLDLDDLQQLAVRLLDEQPDIRRAYQGAYDEILVDEYQDVNPVQQELLLNLRPTKGSIVAVGDEDQAIYSWRQATSTGMLRFPDVFPDSQVIRLERTFRSTKHILRAATTLVAHNKMRSPKSLSTVAPAGERPVRFAARDETEEANWIASQIAVLATREGYRWSDFCILYRLNLQSRPIEEALLRRGIPHQVRGGLRFHDRTEVRLVHAFLRLALDMSDDSAVEYLLQQIPGIGPKRLQALSGMASDGRLADLVLKPESVENLPKDLNRPLDVLRESIAAVGQKRMESLLSVANAAIDATIRFIKYCGHDQNDEASDTLGELRTLAQDLALQKCSLRTFADRIASKAGKHGSSDCVSCMTLHAAKGSEFQGVFIAGMEEGLLPHGQALDSQEKLEEERRLCYVGMTRARTHLFLSYARSRVFGGRVFINQVSRFVDESGRNNVDVRLSPVASSKVIRDVRPGDRILHERWQDGTVLSVEGKGRQAVALINFDGVGTKPVPLWYAPIQHARAQSRPDSA